jgi:hypothetical protein
LLPPLLPELRLPSPGWGFQLPAPSLRKPVPPSSRRASSDRSTRDTTREPAPC